MHPFGWKKMLDWVRITNNNFGAVLFWRTSKTGHCSILSFGLAAATRLTCVPYMIKPGLFLGVLVNLASNPSLEMCKSNTGFFLSSTILTIMWTLKIVYLQMQSQCPVFPLWHLCRWLAGISVLMKLVALPIFKDYIDKNCFLGI